MSEEKTKKTTFHVEINGGAEQKIEVVTSEYALAAITSLGMLEYERADHYQVVKIWIPELVYDRDNPADIRANVPYDGRRVGQAVGHLHGCAHQVYSRQPA
ncbi:hypothetical protein [Pseudomonas amygdali]|uniref:hypothetical protein n=1 Tax=Pseudomonas amygdali TaxID=47877 RepID=UPI0012B7EF98|nr:hypothetical protein [Pseudomonas amygdali]